MTSRSLPVSLVAIGFLAIIYPQPAFAYIDPGSGSLLIQVIFSALVSSVVAVKLFWLNIKLKFRQMMGKPTQSPPSPETGKE